MCAVIFLLNLYLWVLIYLHKRVLKIGPNTKNIGFRDQNFSLKQEIQKKIIVYN